MDADDVRLAVVLGGGGTRGAFEVGVIHALASHGVTPDLLVGTSVGAINAAFWAFHPGADAGLRLLELWKDADGLVSLRAGWLEGLRQVLRNQDHLVRPRGLVRLLERTFAGSGDIQDSHIPLAIVAADLLSGQLVRLRSGPLLEALLASSAIPGLYPPLRVDGQLLVDGGVLANCDVQAAVEAGMSDVIAVDLTSNPEPGAPRNVWGVVERAAGLMLRRQADLMLAQTQRRIRVLAVRPRLDAVPRLRFGDFDRSLALFQAGRVAGAEVQRHAAPRRGSTGTPGRADGFAEAQRRDQQPDRSASDPVGSDR